MPAEPKTKKTKASVSAFIAAVEAPARRQDAAALDRMFQEITGEKPALWGPSIIGYGETQTNTGPWPRTGFSPRKANLVLYLGPSVTEDEEALAKLGKCKTGKACLYINKLADVDEKHLRRLILRAWRAPG